MICLLMEGIVELRPASGIYVAEQQPRPAVAAAPALTADDQMLRPRMPMPLRPRTVQAPSIQTATGCCSTSFRGVQALICFR